MSIKYIGTRKKEVRDNILKIKVEVSFSLLFSLNKCTQNHVIEIRHIDRLKKIPAPFHQAPFVSIVAKEIPKIFAMKKVMKN